MTHPPVRNLFPTHPPGACRLALVGEAPGAEEVLAGAPFVGSAGRLLTKVLLSVGLTRAEVFIGNVCQVRPPANDLSSFAWDGPEIQSGIKALVADLYIFRPHLIVALGNVPLHLFMAGNVPPKSSKSGFVFPFKISHWRGSLFLSVPLTPSTVPPSTSQPPAPSSPSLASLAESTLPPGNDPSGLSSSLGWGVPLEDGLEASPPPLRLPPSKVLAAWHPAGVLREISKAFELRQDLRKAVSEGRSPELSLPIMNLSYGP